MRGRVGGYGGTYRGPALHRLRNAPLPPQASLGDIPVRFLRFDGLSGTERGRSLVWFPPDTMQTGDHLTLGALVNDSGAEVPCALIDMGYHHRINGQDRGVLGYILEADAAQSADLSTVTTYTFRPRTPFTQSRLTALGVRRYSNPLPLGVAAGSPFLKLTGPFTYWHGANNYPTRHPGNTTLGFVLPFGFNAANFTFTPAASANGYTRLDFMLAMKGDGSCDAIAYSNPVTNQALQSVTFFQPQDNMGNTLWSRFYPGTTNPYQMIGLAYVFVPTGVPFTLGTTPLDTAGVVVTTQTGTYKPYSFLPDNGPIAAWVPAGAAYNCASQFATDVIGTAQDFADAGLTPTYNAMVAFADTIYRLEGCASVMDAGSYTQYFPTVNNWEFYASQDAARFYHRAVHLSAHFRAHVLGVGPSWSAWQGANEAHADAATHLYDAMLTGDHSYLAGASSMIYGAEQGQIARGTGGVTLRRTGTGRRGMHVRMGLAAFERMQIQASGVAGGHAAWVLALNVNGAGHGDQEGWLNSDGTSFLDGYPLQNASTNADRDRRMFEYMLYWVTPDVSPSSAGLTLNAGLRFMNLSDYQDDGIYSHGFSSWMQANILSCNVIADTVFGMRPGALEMARDAEEFLYGGVSPQTGAHPYGGDPGWERFNYAAYNATPTGGGSSGYAMVEINPFHHRVMKMLYAQTGETTWRDRVRTLLAAAASANVQGNAMYIFGKTVGEISVHGLSKPLKATD